MEELRFYPQTNERLDMYLSREMSVTRSRVKKLVDDSCVIYNGKILTKCGEKLKQGELVVNIPEEVLINAEPQNLPIDIVYQDKDLAVINKAQGMVTHPCVGTHDGTLVNAIMHHIKDLSAINGVLRPGIVHRLDKDTSGLLVIAKNNDSHLSLAEQIQTKEAGRYYLALVVGNIKENEGFINQPIARSKKDRKVMAVDMEGKEAYTNFKVLERFVDYTLVEFKLKTGRTHQIRVHSKFIKHPIVGDIVYGSKDKFGLNGQLLHAYKLCLRQPTTGENMEFSAPLPDYFERVLAKLRTKSN